MSDERLDRMEGKLDSMLEVQSSMQVTLALNTDHLANHIRRTVILEQELKPVKAHVSFINMLAKLIVGIAALAASLYALFSK